MNTENTTAPGAPAAPPAPQGATPPAGQPPAAPSASEAKPSAADVYERALELDRKVQSERAKLKAEREAWEKQRSAGETEIQRAARLTKLLREDPVAFLDEADVSFDDFQKALARGQQLDPRVEELRKELAELKSRDEERTKTAAEREAQKRRDTAVNEFRSTVTSNAEAYGLTAHYIEADPQNAIGLLEDTVQRLHATTGKIPSYEEAASDMERALVEDTKARLAIPAVRSLVRELLAAEAGDGTQRDDPNQQAQQATPGAAPGGGPPSLGNHHAAQPGPRGARALSRREKMSRLIDAARKDGIGY